MLNKIVKFFLEDKFITFIIIFFMILGGYYTSPFNEENKESIFPVNPVSVDAIPDIGENQQIIFTRWAGRSPKDIDDQITYPLSTALMGISGIKTIRSSSMFGFSSIYLIFQDKIDFYWSRSRILEKLNSLPRGTLPDKVTPTLGPDATALGQIFWYTIEGHDKNGKVTDGWDPEELRSIQDFYLKYGLSSAQGVSEIASIGGYVKEYQIDLDPAAMKAANIGLSQVIKAVKESNIDVGARTMEINRVEYFIRGIGYLKSLKDIENTVIVSRNFTPIFLKDIAKIKFGPAERRGALDKMGAEAVGGVVVARYGENPLKVINNVKEKINELSQGLPEKILPDGTKSKVTIVPFYDRTKLIKETLGTLEDALYLEIIITIIVILIMVRNFKASLLITVLIPLTVLLCFIGMKLFGVEANIVALSGIAIAIGVIADVGIVLSENMIQHLGNSKRLSFKDTGKEIFKSVKEVLPSIVTALATTIISFIPVFMMEASEGKLFRPLAFTKTFMLLASLILAIVVLPALGHLLFGLQHQEKNKEKKFKIYMSFAVISLGLFSFFYLDFVFAIIVTVIGLLLLNKFSSYSKFKYTDYSVYGLVTILIIKILAEKWEPLGVVGSEFKNFLFVFFAISIVMLIFKLFHKYYSVLLSLALEYKKTFLAIPLLLILIGINIWIGSEKFLTPISHLWPNFSKTYLAQSLKHKFPGIGKEFMPSLDEGAFLLMPISMPHAGIEENKKTLKLLDIAVSQIPEIETVVGKLGRVESSLDPAPISMYENLINYKSEYKTDENGRKIKFRTGKNGGFLRDEKGELIPDANGKNFRQWRPQIKSIDDIWNEISKVTKIPGVTSAPKLQPIETRLIMLSTGMRAPLGIKISGSDLGSIEKFGLELEKTLNDVEGVKQFSVFADRIVGKPYIEIIPDRIKLGVYGLSIQDFQKYLEVAVGGMKISSSVEGRKRYPIRIRYPRELRNSPEELEDILIKVNNVTQIKLKELADITYKQGPQVIKSENTFPVSYVLFDKDKKYSEVQVVENAKTLIAQEIKNGVLKVPAGVSYAFAGSFENQVRAEKRLAILIPIVLIIILFIINYQFKRIIPTLIIFSGITMAYAGGFIFIWLYGQEWFLNFDMFGNNLRELFNLKPIFLSVAVWVGFIALFGIATDDGVLITGYLEQIFNSIKPKNTKEIRAAVLKAGQRRIKACLMTTATTVLALLPVLSSTGRGSDIMIPMSIPIFGGMFFELITLFVVPVIYSAWKEFTIKKELTLVIAEEAEDE